MRLVEKFDGTNLEETGDELYQFASRLFPICRSITGEGLRQTLREIRGLIPLEIHEVPTGSQVFDWVVPKEWNIRDAYIKRADGERIVDFRRSNIGVLNYSTPIHATLPLEELKPHLLTDPNVPDSIPYRTSYYAENWGFCLPHREMLALKAGSYEVLIDSTLEDGFLSYGECFLPGGSQQEVLISAHACHPSLANDNLSGVSVAAYLARFLAGRQLYYSYRFLFVPGTIGAIAWLARNRESIGRIRHGLVLTCLGDCGGFHYKKTRRGNAEIDRAMTHVLAHQEESSEILDFSPVGYDERQYCSPGFNLPVGCLMRSVWGTFPEYHTSADNLEFIRPLQLARSLRVCAAILDVLENNRRFCNQKPYCEPQLGRRNLYNSGACADEIPARLWTLNLSDGEHSLLDIAERSGLPFLAICKAADALAEGGLLKEIPIPERA